MKRNTLTTAVLAGLTGMAGMVSVSNAVNVNPDGLGQVLMYPYYTARGGNDTLISIVNTTDRGKAVKIRFLEALNSREVLDFNIYMSEWDVWVGAVTADPDGGGLLRTTDSTCTTPLVFDANLAFGDVLPGGRLNGEVSFFNRQYTGSRTDAGPQGEERNASGHIEFIEMGELLPTPVGAPAKSSASYVPFAAKHSGVLGSRKPNDCAYLVDLWRDPAPGAGDPGPGGTTHWNFNPRFGFNRVDGDGEVVVSGGLFGAASIINGLDGVMFSYNATAVDGFWANSIGNHTNPGSVFPSIAGGGEDVSNVFVNGQVVTTDWPASIFAVNATITYDALMNEYNVQAGLGAQSEWVLTLPTKRFHTDAEGILAAVDPDEPIAPFTNTWHDTPSGLNFPCEDMSFTVWDREELTPSPETGGVEFSPRPDDEDPQVFQLCRETNVVRYALPGDLPSETEILREPLRDDGAFRKLGYANFSLPGFDAGWIRFDMGDIPTGGSIAAGADPAIIETGQRVSVEPDQGNRTLGLPVIGFWVNTFQQSSLADEPIRNYGGTFDHHGSRDIFTDTIIID